MVLGTIGQRTSFGELQQLVFDFEGVLKRFGVSICPGSELEGACCSVLEILGRNQSRVVQNPGEDVREVFAEALGIWTFLKKIVRLQNHRCFDQFTPHLKLLNKGTVVQNKRIRACQEATNKIFELLFALVLLDVSSEVILDHPDLAKGDNPDVLALIDGVWWGFACKTLYGTSGKTLFANIKKGVDQIEVAPRADIGIVVVNLRNMISHERCWPLMNETEYRAGEEPIFGACPRPQDVIPPLIGEMVTLKRDEVIREIELSNVLNIFTGKKALPAFLAFCQTCTATASAAGPVPTSILTLSIGSFQDPGAHMEVFEKINQALHERI